ncbi:hypothetical protein HHX47_DHR7000657 [Lentinula edodes]|nr:hypothetical protein HHX47_DHR7000657 [Lentinula edodes]
MITDLSMADFNATLQVLKELVPPALQNPRVGIICGSGLSGLAATLRQTVLVPYDRLPGFVHSTVPGHKSSLAFGLMGSGAGVPVIAMLGRLVFRAAHDLSIKRDALAEGTYAWVSGPTYETPAEGRFLRAAGADVVGMSTVPEVLAAREEGMNVLVLSLVTNAVVIPTDYRSVRDEFESENTGMSATSVVDEVVSHEEVLALGKLKGDLMKTIVEKVIDLIPSDV